MRPPFEILDCSWPRPVRHADGLWTSAPEWDAPRMPARPQAGWRMISGRPCWTIDWRAFFGGGLVSWDGQCRGEMWGFHVAFRIRASETGKLIFWADDGCVIRRNGQVVHEDKWAHMPICSDMDVERGDILEIAQWQKDGEWVWGAQPICDGRATLYDTSVLWAYYESSLEKMQHPNGPPLKMYSDARHPFRTIISIYSLILNGYVPSEILIFGEHQWDSAAKQLVSSMIPFAEIVPADKLNGCIHMYGGSELVERALQHWWVMKTFTSLLYPPGEFCAMDDDVFILDHTSDALEAFKHCDLVFAEDIDHREEYMSAWEPAFGQFPLSETAKLNAGLYWMRNVHDPAMIGDFALRLSPSTQPEYVWEQGFIANLYADRNVWRLPRHRYFYPLFGGLPGGMLGYDYRGNPCGFSSIHFGGLREKPTDDIALALAPEILAGRSTLSR